MTVFISASMPAASGFAALGTRFSSFIYLVCSANYRIAESFEAGLQTLEKIEFRTPFLILHEEVEFELPVPEAVLETRSLKTRVRIRKKNMRLGRMQAERLAVGVVFQIYLLQFLVQSQKRPAGRMEAE